MNPENPERETLAFRPARRDEVPAIMALLGDDILGKTREQADAAIYLAAFDAMRSEGVNQVIVGLIGKEIVACYQLTFISGLSLSATRRAQVEGVRVARTHRGQGIGEAMFRDAETRARAAGCGLLQFTTNKSRADAQRFYDRLGFTPSHIGYKKAI